MKNSANKEGPVANEGIIEGDFMSASDETMTLDRALALMRRIPEDILPLEKRWQSFGGAHWDLSAELPESDNLWVVTRDGVSFSVQLFSGAYSNRYEWTIDNEGEWDIHLAALRRNCDQREIRALSR